MADIAVPTGRRRNPHGDGSDEATADEIAGFISFRDRLPAVLVQNMRELHQYVEDEPAIAGPQERTNSLRSTDGSHRHGAPLVYHECSPNDTGWEAVDERTATDTRLETIGIIVAPPDESGAALINLFKYDQEMVEGLISAADTLAARVRLLVKAHLRYIDPRLTEQLATVTQYD